MILTGTAFGPPRGAQALRPSWVGAMLPPIIV